MFFWNSLAFWWSSGCWQFDLWFLCFSKTSMNIKKFMVHVLLKPGLENFEHYFTFFEHCLSLGLEWKLTLHNYGNWLRPTIYKLETQKSQWFGSTLEAKEFETYENPCFHSSQKAGKYQLKSQCKFSQTIGVPSYYRESLHFYSIQAFSW